MKLITELTEQVAFSKQEDGALYIEGIFAQADLKNRNKRIYPKSVLEKSVAEYVRDYVDTNRALGELNHPPQPQVNPERACIKIESLTWDGNNVIGKAKVLTTPAGNILSALIHDNVQLGVSTRGLGTVKKVFQNNAETFIVEDDYQLKAIDVVYNPSGINCFVDGILENVDYYYDNGVLCEKEITEIKRNLSHKDINKIVNVFTKALKRL